MIRKPGSDQFYRSPPRICRRVTARAPIRPRISNFPNRNSRIVSSVRSRANGDVARGMCAMRSLVFLAEYRKLDAEDRPPQCIEDRFPFNTIGSQVYTRVTEPLRCYASMNKVEREKKNVLNGSRGVRRHTIHWSNCARPIFANGARLNGLPVSGLRVPRAPPFRPVDVFLRSLAGPVRISARVLPFLTWFAMFFGCLFVCF